MAALQHDFVIGGIEWVVVAYEQLDEATAAREWQALYDAHPKGNFSVWRTTTPERSHWLLILCGRPEDLEKVTVPGVPFQLDQGTAQSFALRRARVAIDAINEGATESVRQEAHYGPDGARIHDDGRIR
jgi:hypothetical protein